MAEAHLDAGSVGRGICMAGSQCHRGAGRQRRDLAAILDPGSLGGGERVARSNHAAPRRDRNDGDVAAPGVVSGRVGRGERLGHGGGAVTVPGAARLVERALRLRTPSFLPVPRPRYLQERKILSLMNPSVPIRGPYFGVMHGPRAAASCRPPPCRDGDASTAGVGGMLL